MCKYGMIGLGLLLLTIFVPQTLGAFGVAWWSDVENLKVVGATRLEDEYVLLRLGRIGGIFHPGEPIEITLANPPAAQRPAGAGAIELVAFDTGSWDARDTGFVHGQEARRITRGTTAVVATDLKALTPCAEGITGVLKAPAELGMYAIVLRRENGERTLLGGLARVLNPTARVGPYRQIMVEYGLPQPLYSSYYNDEEICAAIARLGVGLIRREIGPGLTQPGQTELVHRSVGEWDTLFAAARKFNIQVMITAGAHPQEQWPWAASGRTLSHVLPAKYDPELKQWYTNFARRYWSGGASGLWGIEHWNEPWEPQGISGWNADSRRYRQILEVIHDAVRSVDPRIKVLAAGSMANTEDKLLSGPDRRHMKMVDIMTDHYVSLWASYGPRVAEQHGIVSGETETWGAQSQLLAGQFLTQFLSGGQKFLNPVTVDMLWTENGQAVQFAPPARGNRPGVVTPMPVAVSLAAWNALIQDRLFQKIVFTDRLPLIYQFGPDHDARLVLTGKLTSTGSGRLRDYPWSQVHAGPAGRLNFADRAGVIEVRDFAGNVLPRHQGGYELVLDGRLYYLSSARGATTVIDAVAAGKITGMRHVHIAPQHLPTLPTAGAAVELPVTVHNVSLQNVTGILQVQSLVDTAAPESVEMSLAGGAEKTVRVPVRTASPGGTPMRFVFTPAGAPPETWQEVIHVTGIKRATPRTDKDWESLPTVMVVRGADDAANDEIEKIWRPWVQQPQARIAARAGQVQLAWDDQNLYIRAVVDNPQLTPKQRLATWDQEQYFWSSKDMEKYQPLMPYAKFVAIRSGDKKALETAAQDPQWPAYQQLLKDKPELAQLAASWKTYVIFSTLQRRPNASLDEINHVYRGDFTPDLPFNGDVFQFAFDFDAPEVYMTATHDLKYPADVMPRGWTAIPDSDYEFALYLCNDGRPELWCLLAPGMPRSHYFPRADAGELRQHAVAAPATVAQQQDRILYQTTLAWKQLGVTRPAEGMSLGFTFRFGRKDGVDLMFGANAGATKSNGLTLHPHWMPSPSNTLRWTLTR